MNEKELYHFGLKGMKWGERRFQNEDGSLTPAGRARYSVGEAKAELKSAKASYKAAKRSEQQSRKEERAAYKQTDEYKEKRNKAIKTAAVIGGTAVVAGLAIYGAKKYSDAVKHESIDIGQKLTSKQMGLIIRGYNEHATNAGNLMDQADKGRRIGSDMSADKVDSLKKRSNAERYIADTYVKSYRAPIAGAENANRMARKNVNERIANTVNDKVNGTINKARSAIREKKYADRAYRNTMYFDDKNSREIFARNRVKNIGRDNEGRATFQNHYGQDVTVFQKGVGNSPESRKSIEKEANYRNTAATKSYIQSHLNATELAVAKYGNKIKKKRK